MRRSINHYALRTMHRALFTATALAAAAASAGPKKYIAFAWEFKSVTPANVLANADKFAETPLDGIGILLGGTNAAGERFGSGWDPHFVNGTRWDKKGIRKSVGEWREVHDRTTLKNCFVFGFRQPMKRLDWTDDEAWEKFANNIAVAAWAAQETGFKGMFCDTEDYHGVSQFYHSKPKDPPVEECRKLARRRGAECFGGAFRECPDLKVFFFWLLSQQRTDYSTSALLGPDNNDKSGWLWPAFVDGILDVITPGAKLIDGDEWGYFYEYSTRDFHEGALNQVFHAQRLLAPENRAKYAAHISPSFGIYMDCYVYPGGWWCKGPVAGSRLEHLRRNMADATECAGDFVWLWGEHRTWIDWSEDTHIRPHVFKGVFGLKDRKDGEPWRWEDWIPGVNETLKMTKGFDAGCAARMKQLRAAGTLTNLIAHGDCQFPGLTNDFTKGVPPPFKGFLTYNNGGRMGVDRTVGEGDASSVLAQGAKYAIVTYVRDKVEPGEVYAFEVSARSENMGAPNAYMSWRGSGDVPAVKMKFGEPDENGWRRGVCYFKVPLSLRHIWACVQIRQGGDDTKKVWIDNFALYRLWP